MLLAVISGFLLALFAPVLRRVAGHGVGWVLAALPAGLFIYFAQALPAVGHGERLRESTPWVPILDGVDLSFSLDGLSLLFALLITGIGTFIVLYAAAYLKGHNHLGRFLSFLLAFMASMLGLVLADNVITFFVFWEMTSITSFLLIGFSHSKPASRRAAVQALVVTGGGGLVMLAGLLVMASIGGSLEFSVLLAQGDLYREHAAYGPLLILLLAGAFTKSAQVPFHFWLPNAMEAPTPVSAYLHSATMVKAGVYLLARIHPAMGDTALWETLLTGFGALTFLAGTLLAIRQTDLKLILAYTTVASLGLLVMLLGVGSEKAVTAAMTYLLAHSLFKGALFMVAGGVDHSTGTRDATILGGIGRAMPITAVAGALAVLSMAGVPPFVGFLAKEVIYKGTLAGDAAVLVTAVAVVGNILMGAAGGLAGIRPFIGRRMPTPKEPHEGSPSLWLGALVLAVLGIVSIVDLHWTSAHIVGPAVSAIYPGAKPVDLHLWSGVNLPLVLSMITLAGALTVYLAGPAIRNALIGASAHWWGPDRGYDQALAGVRAAAGGLTGLLQSGRLSAYTAITFTVLAVTLAVPVFSGMPIRFALEGMPDFYALGVMVLTAVAAIAVMLLRQRLLAVVAAGVVGAAISLIFLLFGAPDLAFTQFMVETLSVVILTLVLLHLPVDVHDSRTWSYRLRDGAIAGSIGVMFALTLMAITAQPVDLRLSDYFAEASYLAAYGRNVVNVILVDFRALDTFGEISVVMVAGISALALMGAGLRLRRRGSTGDADATHRGEGTR
ncbi:MAG: putative monovalent cation/H+ antiporter subunit A [Alphaproteobacteria bacterium]